MEQTTKKASKESQADFIAQCRSEACLDPNIPLGKSPAPNPEFGPTVSQYFSAKHARGECGKFFPLHELIRRPSYSNNARRLGA
jgi:hypothetical protein